MPKNLFFLFCITLSFCSFGQDKVDWTINYDALTESIIFTAAIEEGWHLYSQNINEGIGPVPTSIEFDANKKTFKLIGKTIEPTPITEYDPNFEGELSFFKDSVEIIQKIKLKASGEVSGKITFMVCTEEMCLPPVDIDFNLMIEKR